MSLQWRKSVFTAVCLASLTAPAVFAQDPDLTYHPVPTCVVVYTPTTGGIFAANESRTYNVVGNGSFASQGGSSTGCGVPGFSNGIAQVQAVELNVIATLTQAAGNLVVQPSDQFVDRTMVSFPSGGATIADTGAVAVSQTSGVGDITIKASAITHVIVKVVGYYTKAVQTVHVHPVPGDHTASGTRLVNALAGITNASSTKRYVVKIEPGIYDVGSTGLQMKSYVDLEGTGQEATVIRGEGGSSDASNGVVLGAASSEIRELQVKADSTAAATVAILMPSGGSSNVRNVTVSSTGTQAAWGIRNVSLASVKVEGATVTTTTSGSQDGYGISTKLSGSSLIVKRTVISVSGGTGKRYGISAFTTAALSEIRDVEINVSSSNVLDYGVYTDSLSSSATSIFNSSITATRFGVEHSGDVLVDNCVIAGGDASVVANGGGIGATRLDGSAFGPTCAGVYDASFTFYSSTCP